MNGELTLVRRWGPAFVFTLVGVALIGHFGAPQIGAGAMVCEGTCPNPAEHPVAMNRMILGIVAVMSAILVGHVVVNEWRVRR